MPQIAVINRSTVVTARAINAMLPAFDRQWTRDLRPVWGVDAAEFTVVPANRAPPRNAWWLVFLDDSHQAHRQAYHDLTSEGLPISKVYARTLLKRGTSVSVGASHEAQARRVPNRRTPMRILVVDDNVDAAEMLADVLRLGDRVVEVAHDALEALSGVERFAPDAVVLDIGLPVMDGYELARRLRERESEHPGPRRLRLIALTGYGHETDRQRSADAGMDVHLLKPVDPVAIEAALANEPTPGTWPA